MIFIYLIFNKINGKLYVGLSNNVKRRWSEHKKRSKKITNESYTVHLAMNKYGIDNFEIKSVDEAKSLDEANAKERSWIAILKQMGYQLYNETDGGSNCPAHNATWTDKRRKAASERISGENNYFYGKQLFGELNGNYGKKMKPHVKEILLQHRAKLTPEQVQEIRDLYATGNYTQTKLANMFNMSLTQAHRIVMNKRWNDGEKPKEKANLKPEQVLEIRRLYASGNYLQKDLAGRFDVSIDHISAIVNRRKWSNI